MSLDVGSDCYVFLWMFFPVQNPVEKTMPLVKLESNVPRICLGTKCQEIFERKVMF